MSRHWFSGFRATFPSLMLRPYLVAALGLPCFGQFVTEFVVPQPAHVAQEDALCLGPDGNLWFTCTVPHPDPTLDSVVCGLGKITGDGQVTIDVLPNLYPRPRGLARDGEGNLWWRADAIDEDFERKFCRRTPGGDITTFDAPKTCMTGSVSIVGRMTLGPDGNVWATYSCPAQILRITPEGDIDAFDAGVGLPNWITAGPDGALWYTLEMEDAAGDAIGRITTSGSVTTFPLPAEGCHDPYAIATGSDGALWFTNQFWISGCGFGLVGRMTTSGDLTTLPEPLTAWSMLGGPDGNVWLGVSGGAAWSYGIARLTPADGSMTQLPMASPRSVFSLKNDLQGRVWYSAEEWGTGISIIGRVTLADSFPVPSEGFVAIASVKAPFGDQSTPSSLRCKGWLDVASAAVDLGADVTVRVNGASVLAGAPAVKTSGKAALLLADGTKLKFSHPIAGSSRVGFSLSVAQPTFLTDPNGACQLEFEFAQLTVQSEVQLTDGAFAPKDTATGLSAEVLHPAKARAKLKGMNPDTLSSKDSLVLSVILGGLGAQPAESPALDVFMTPVCAVSVPAGACKSFGGKFTYSAKAPHPFSLSLNWPTGRLKIKTSKTFLGDVPEGSSDQSVIVGIDGAYRSAGVTVSRTGGQLKY